MEALLVRDSFTKLEEHLFLDIVRLGKEAAGGTIWSDYCERAGENIAIGQVYANLDKMERKGFITSRLETVVTNDGKKRKVRFFAPTDDGREALRNSRATSNAFWKGVKI